MGAHPLLLELHHLDLESKYLILDLLLNIHDPTRDELHFVLNGLNFLVSIVRGGCVRGPWDGLRSVGHFCILRSHLVLQCLHSFHSVHAPCFPAPLIAWVGIEAQNAASNERLAPPDRLGPHIALRAWIVTLVQCTGIKTSIGSAIAGMLLLGGRHVCLITRAGRTPVFQPEAADRIAQQTQ